MTIAKNIVLKGKHIKPITLDVFFTENDTPKPIIIFCHGYKGFKDWGAWNLMAKTLANAGFFFVKFNFSHNGGTVKQPIDFPDLDAFGNNNYTKELDDLHSVINWITSNQDYKNNINTNSINLIGHSRGGGIVTIKAEEDKRITKVIGLASVSDYGSRYPMNTNLEQWKLDKVIYVQNGRTKQQMPHFYQFYEDFIANEERLTIKRAVSDLKQPYLIIHGDNDTSVSIEEAYALHKWNTKSKLEVIKDANHVFNTSHPWEKNEFPWTLKTLIDKIVIFLRN